MTEDRVLPNSPILVHEKIVKKFIAEMLREGLKGGHMVVTVQYIDDNNKRLSKVVEFDFLDVVNAVYQIGKTHDEVGKS